MDQVLNDLIDEIALEGDEGKTFVVEYLGNKDIEKNRL